MVLAVNPELGELDACPECGALAYRYGDEYEALTSEDYDGIHASQRERIEALERENSALRAELQPRLMEG